MIDVSEYQGHVNWAKVAASGVKVAAIKAGEGLYEKDIYYDYNYLAARKAGILACPYFFGHPSEDPRAQARHFLSLMGSDGLKAGHGRPGLDIEVSEHDDQAQLIAWCKAWYEVIDAAIHAPAIHYTYSAMAAKFGTAFINHPLWIANYDFDPGIPASKLPIGFWKPRGVVAHQFTDKGQKPGIKGNVDISRRYTLTLYRFRIPRRIIQWK